jgi:hypothetical protein
LLLAWSRLVTCAVSPGKIGSVALKSPISPKVSCRASRPFQAGPSGTTGINRMTGGDNLTGVLVGVGLIAGSMAVLYLTHWLAQVSRTVRTNELARQRFLNSLHDAASPHLQLPERSAQPATSPARKAA